MEKSINLNRATSWYVFLFSLWAVSVAAALSIQSKADLFLLINHARNPILDVVATMFTCMGDGAFTGILAVICICTRRRQLAWQLLCSFLLSTVFCQVLKNIADELRPAGFFPDASIVLHPSWTTPHRYNSFPSGHTTTAFSTATIFAFYFKKVKVSLLCFFMAAMVGYSRVYLGQHFVGDVFTGSLLGALTAGICILNYKNALIQNGLGLEYLFKKKKKLNERSLENIL